MTINNFYTRTGMLVVGLTLFVLGFFIDIKLSIFGLGLWIYSVELNTAWASKIIVKTIEEIYSQLPPIMKERK